MAEFAPNHTEQITPKKSVRGKVVAGLAALSLVGGAAVAANNPQEVKGVASALADEAPTPETDVDKYMNSAERNKPLEEAAQDLSNAVINYANREIEGVTFDDGEKVDGKGILSVGVSKGNATYSFTVTAQKSEGGSYSYAANDGKQTVKGRTEQIQGDRIVGKDVAYSRDFWGDGYEPYTASIGGGVSDLSGMGYQGGSQESGPHMPDDANRTVPSNALVEQDAIAASHAMANGAFTSR